MQFPAQLIAEAIDQTRGWFYSLLAVNTLVFGATPYEHVLCLGHIVDENGKKMSKSVRATSSTRGKCSTPAAPTRCAGGCSPRARRGRRRARVSGRSTRRCATRSRRCGTPSVSSRPTPRSTSSTRSTRRSPRPRSVAAIDRWILSRLETSRSTVTTALDGYEPLGGTDALASLIDDLSNWYVRRSRRRFWRTDPRAPRSDSLAAQATLLEVLQRVTLLLAPFCPFVAERLYRELFGVGDDDSVHLADWPVGEPRAPRRRARGVDGGGATPDVARSRGARRRRESRSANPSRARWSSCRRASSMPPAGIVEDELNVDELEYGRNSPKCLSFELVPNFRSVGPRLGEAVKELKPALRGPRLGGRRRDARSRRDRSRSRSRRARSNSAARTWSCA